jgi:hypothetical protein
LLSYLLPFSLLPFSSFLRKHIFRTVSSDSRVVWGKHVNCKNCFLL